MDRGETLSFLHDLEKEISLKHRVIYSTQKERLIETFEIEGVGKLSDILNDPQEIPVDVRESLEIFARVPAGTFLSARNWGKYVLDLELSKFIRREEFDLAAVGRVRKVVTELF